MREHAAGAVIVDQSDATALVAIQGPRALGHPPDAHRRWTWRRFPTTGSRAARCWGRRRCSPGRGTRARTASRCTCSPQRAAELWNALLEAGTPLGLLPCGLGARDTLRLEAKMALYGNDIDDEHTVLEADLGWIVKLQKGEFIGRDALARQKAEGVDAEARGFRDGGARHRAVALSDRQRRRAHRRGDQRSAVPLAHKTIGLGYVAIAHAAVGTAIEILIRDQPVAARIVPTPFYKRAR